VTVTDAIGATATANCTIVITPTFWVNAVNYANSVTQTGPSGPYSATPPIFVLAILPTWLTSAQRTCSHHTKPKHSRPL
jgi:hypothetical protein